jgi:Transglycosylase-like domain
VPDANALLDAIMARESGDRNVYNYMHSQRPDYYTASGYYQIVDSTWKEGAKLAGVDSSQYPTAISAPKDVQTQIAQALLARYGERPWAQSAKPGSALAPPQGPRQGLLGQVPAAAPPIDNSNELAAAAPSAPASGPDPLVALRLMKLLVPAGHGLVPVDYDPFAPGMPGALAGRSSGNA